MAGSFRYLCAGPDGSKVSEKMLINMNNYERDLGQKKKCKNTSPLGFCSKSTKVFGY